MILLPFTKMHGLGNDFIIIDDLNSPSLAAALFSASSARQICDRRLGVGADQILWLKKPAQSHLDVRMEIFNADGSVAEMCGNGIRAVALYLNQYGPEKKLNYTVETLAGVKTVEIQANHEVTVDMGKPQWDSSLAEKGEQIEIQGQAFQFFEVNMGNPHVVLFLPKVDEFPVEKWGSWIEVHPRFPQRTNVEFVQILDSHSIQVRVWERGAGITLACGTGACAAAVATLGTRKAQSPLKVKLPGGDLQISWQGGTASVMMRGSATEVFHGSYCWK